MCFNNFVTKKDVILFGLYYLVQYLCILNLKRMTQTTQINDFLKQSHLDWNVRTEEIVTKSGIEVPGKIALIRDDNNESLGVHSDTYVPYQNHELMELLFRIAHRWFI